MGPFVLLHVALVGFFCCAALYSAWTWWHARADRTLLLFAVQCLLSVVLSANFVVVATAGDVGRINVALSVRLVAGLMSMAVTARMIGRLTGWRPRFFLNGISVFVAAAVLHHLALHSMQSGVTSLVRVTLAWGETITVPSRTGISWIIVPTYVIVLTVNLYGIIGAAKLYTRDRLGAMLVGLAATSGFITTVSGMRTDLFGVPLPYFGIVPFAFWVVFIAFQLSRESARTAGRETQAQQRLRAVFDHTLHFMGLLDVNGVVLEANRPVLEAVGVSPDAVLGKPVWQTPLWSHSDELREGVRRATQAAAAGKTIRFETWHPLGDGSIGYVDFSVTPIKDENGKVVLLVPEGRDITARKKTQQALDRLVDVVAPRTGQEFFQTMVDSLCEICEVDVVMAASVDPAVPTMMRTIAVSRAGQPADNFSYPLAGSPCEAVIGRELCYYPSNVQSLFPDDRGLAELGIESYMGIPIQSSDGRAPGIVALMRKGEMNRPDQARALLQVVAARAGAELERQRTGAALMESESRFRALIEHLDVGVVMQDAQDRILVTNPAAARMLGLTEEQLRGEASRESGWALLAEDGSPLPFDRAPHALAARTGQPVGNVIVGATSLQTGGRTWLQVAATPQLGPDGLLRHVLVTFVDVTDRKRAEDALRSNSRRLSLAISATSDAVWERNYQTGGTYYSPRWFEMLGIPPRPMTIDTWKSLCHPDDLEPALNRIEAMLAASGPVGYEVELRMRRGDGTWAWLLERGNAVERDATDRPLLVAGTSTDITQRKDAEARRRELETRLAQAHRMESMGRLAGGIAHDFNNILTVINGYSDLLLHTVKFDASAAEMLTDIRNAGERAAALTRQLLTFSRHQVVDPDVLELNVIVGDTERMLQRLIGENIQLNRSLSSRPLWVRADAGQIGQVIVNLVVNARDSMPDGGTLTVSTQHATLDEAAAAGVGPDARPGEYAVLTMTDTGTGIPTELQELVFEPFFTTKGPGKGTGLGLTTVHGIVRQSGGFLRVQSQPGAGSTFEIYLPLAEEPEPSSSACAECSSGTTAKRTVLMTEDETSVRHVAEVMLRRVGYEVLSAANADEALKIAAAHEGPIDLLLTDVIMPGMNGRQLAERLLAERPGLRVLYMSGYTDDSLVQHVVLNTDASYLQKPFDAETLSRKVRQAFEVAPPSPN